MCAHHGNGVGRIAAYRTTRKQRLQSLLNDTDIAVVIGRAMESCGGSCMGKLPDWERQTEVLPNASKERGHTMAIVRQLDSGCVERAEFFKHRLPKSK